MNLVGDDFFLAFSVYIKKILCSTSTYVLLTALFEREDFVRDAGQWACLESFSDKTMHYITKIVIFHSSSEKTLSTFSPKNAF